MGSDRARDTYDDGRQYRRVVQQQGRVVLEADTNEAQQIIAEEMRRGVLDVVGQSGVPWDPNSGAAGNGYHVTHAADAEQRDFQIGVGTFYVDGMAVRQNDGTLRYGNQRDWLDGPTPTLKDIQSSKPSRELVYLRLRAQEVSAVEDPALLEPALGGPDTAQRVRLVRRVCRAAGDKPLDKIDWGQGILVNSGQTTLARTARLSVGFDPATNAYVGRENQMIRVQGGVLANTASAVATQLLWAFDNAASLYSATVPDPTNLTTLKLATTPVDVAHQPKSNQYVEVLVAAAQLGDNAYAAAPTGMVLQVGSYDPKAQTIVLRTALPDSYGTAMTPLFLRVWENSVDASAAFAVGGAPLVDSNNNKTGLQVELTDETNQTPSVVPGDYWCFAVRPSAPTSVYPARYSQPQPPEGPREWACALAVIYWANVEDNYEKQGIIDCRHSFGTLTSLSKAADDCSYTYAPQDLLDQPVHAWINDLAEKGQQVTIRFKPGRYQLEEPIRLRKAHSNITIEASGGNVEFEAAGHAHEKFGRGLVDLHEADGVTLRGLRFVVPEASFSNAVAQDLPEFVAKSHTAHSSVGRAVSSMRLSVGLRLGSCADLTIENCTFSFRRGSGRQHTGTVCGGCIVADGAVSGLSLKNCLFQAADVLKNDESHMLFGYLHAPPASNARELFASADAEKATDVFTHQTREGHSASIEEALFHRNTFHGLTAATLILGSAGHLRMAENRVRDSYGGVWIFALNGGKFELEDENGQAKFLSVVARDPRVYWTLALARCLLPLPTSRKQDGQPSRFSLHFQDNVIDVASAAMVGWHAAGDDGGRAIITGNIMNNNVRAMPTAGLDNVRVCSLAANALIHGATTEDTFTLAFVASHGNPPVHFAASANAYDGGIVIPENEPSVLKVPRPKV